jgi:quinol monooxygenase YgiN
LILVTGHVRLPPEQMYAVRPLMRAVLEATRREPGCLLYAYGEDVLDPGVIRVVERWRDWASLEAHGKTPHVIRWRASLKRIGVIEREITAHEAGEARSL